MVRVLLSGVGSGIKLSGTSPSGFGSPTTPLYLWLRYEILVTSLCHASMAKINILKLFFKWSSSEEWGLQIGEHFQYTVKLAEGHKQYVKYICSVAQYCSNVCHMKLSYIDRTLTSFDLLLFDAKDQLFLNKYVVQTFLSLFNLCKEFKHLIGMFLSA